MITKTMQKYLKDFIMQIIFDFYTFYFDIALRFLKNRPNNFKFYGKLNKNLWKTFKLTI